MESVGRTGNYPLWMRDMAVAGFGSIETFSFDIDAVYTHEAWRGRIRASAGVGASLAPEAVAAFDDELRAMLAERWPDDPMPALIACSQRSASRPSRLAGRGQARL